MTNLPYNEKDISSIFNYSKQLVNKCLRDFAPDAEEHKGKGSLGQLVEELFFKYDLNSRLSGKVLGMFFCFIVFCIFAL